MSRSSLLSLLALSRSLGGSRLLSRSRPGRGGRSSLGGSPRGCLLLGDQRGDLALDLAFLGLQLRLGVVHLLAILQDLLSGPLRRCGLLLEAHLGGLILQGCVVVLVDGAALVGGEAVDVLGSQQAVGGVADRVAARRQGVASPVHVGLNGVLLQGLSGGKDPRPIGRHLFGGLGHLALQRLDGEHVAVVLLNKRRVLLAEGLYAIGQGVGLGPEVET